MAQYDWVGLLDHWKRDILANRYSDYRRVVPQTLWSAGAVGAPGAGEAQLAATERRLGVALPPSYRQFLATMDGGWMPTVFEVPYHFWSSGEVEWFAAREGQTLEIWIDKDQPMLELNHLSGDVWIDDAEYFAYENGVAWGIRDAYLRHCLAVSDHGDDSSMYLLNPLISTPDGEWEAWRFDFGETCRFPSFWEMLHHEYQAYIESRPKFRRITP